MNKTNVVWQGKISSILKSPDYTVSPRGLEVKEIISGNYQVPMPAYLDLLDRKININFMFAEAAWIISGSNRLSEISRYMKVYGNFSDDQVFLRGAYGPKVVDQLGFVVDTLEGDNSSRQAVINIWRERPGTSKDIPCTLSMQFLIRKNRLHCVTTMRSQDIILGFTYDVFTFSMIAYSVLLLLRARGIHVQLGRLYVNAGSMHIYKTHYKDAKKWSTVKKVDKTIAERVKSLKYVETYEDLILTLQEEANS